jgi:hypothetical protein
LADNSDRAGVEGVGGALGAGAKEAGDFAGFVKDGAVGERVVRFFQPIAAAHEEAKIVDESGLSLVEHLLDKHADLIPNLSPNFACPPAECPRMFGEAKHGNIGVVVKKCHLWAPANPHRVLGIEHQVYDVLEARGPRFDGAKRSGRPIVFDDPSAHFAVTEDALKCAHRFGGAVLGYAINGGDEVVGDVGLSNKGARIDLDGLPLNNGRFVLGNEDHFGAW